MNTTQIEKVMNLNGEREEVMQALESELVSLHTALHRHGNEGQDWLSDLASEKLREMLVTFFDKEVPVVVVKRGPKLRPVSVVVEGKGVVVVTGPGRAGISRCHPTDEFNVNEGRSWAALRAEGLVPSLSLSEIPKKDRTLFSTAMKQAINLMEQQIKG